MKNVSLLLLLINAFCNAQIITIPDANFKARLLAANATNGIACLGVTSSGCLPGVIDINGNGEIEVSEAENVAVLFVSNPNIVNLTGIEYFTNLERLECAFNNNLTSINISQLTSLKKLQCRNNQLTSLNLSGLTQLEELSCQNNQLTSVDISQQTQLKQLLCEGNQITSLNFTNCPLLQRVYCGNNLLTTLDFGANPQLNDLGCRNNPNLTSINIKNSTTQLFGTATLFNQCWNNIPNLSYICADSSEISALQSFLAGCGVTQAITIDSACPLSVNEYDLNSIIVSPNPSDGVFEVKFSCKASSEDVLYNVYDVLGKKLFEKKVTFENSGFEVNLVDHPVGVYQLRIKVGNSIINKKLIKK
ncbi:leucine-rich repeat domain-containing protein [Flavobacterium sp.]